MSDGILDGPSLVQIAKSVEAQIIFLNGCETIELGQQLVDEHIPVAICTLRSVDDVMARETSQLFYKALAQTNNVRAAYNMSKPPIKGGYTILTNGITDVSLTPILEKLAEFSSFILRNDNEHIDIVKAIQLNEEEHTNILNALTKARIWNIIIMFIGMIGVGLVVGLLGMLGRGALP